MSARSLPGRLIPGLTLLEVLIVVAIVSIVGSISSSLYINWRASSLNREAVTRIESVLSAARQEAKRLTSSVAVTATDGNSHLTINGRQVDIGATLLTSTGTTQTFSFSGVLGVQEPYTPQVLGVSTGTGVFERNARITIVPPLAKTATVIE